MLSGGGLKVFCMHNKEKPLPMDGWPNGWPSMHRCNSAVDVDARSSNPVAVHFYPGLGLVAYSSYLASDGSPNGEASPQDHALKYYLTQTE
jgi:hypothetical protein